MRYLTQGFRNRVQANSAEIIPKRLAVCATIESDDRNGAMRTFVALIMLCVLFLAVDAVLLNGRYRDALWHDAKYQGEAFSRMVHAQLRKIGL
jgi:hypothetical protein